MDLKKNFQSKSAVNFFLKDFVNYIKAYDVRRDKNFSDTFPEFAKLLEDWNV